jgi:hypothetical protein
MLHRQLLSRSRKRLKALLATYVPTHSFRGCSGAWVGPEHKNEDAPVTELAVQEIGWLAWAALRWRSNELLVLWDWRWRGLSFCQKQCTHEQCHYMRYHLCPSVVYKSWAQCQEFEERYTWHYKEYWEETWGYREGACCVQDRCWVGPSTVICSSSSQCNFNPSVHFNYDLLLFSSRRQRLPWRLDGLLG